MHLHIHTRVKQPYQQVWAGFDETLFRSLAPPFPPVKVLQFDGCLREDVVSLELNFLFFKQQWTSRITDQQTTEKEIFFVDEGTKLPFFLRYWRHKHRLISTPDGHTVIADEIEFKTPFPLMDYLMYPALWAQFMYRKPIYRRVFG
jgi:ligand-binding SRPBCC domain-containing protein